MLHWAIAGLLISQAQVEQRAPTSIEQLDWLTGSWEELVEEGPHASSWTLETWTPPRGGVMLGTSLSGKSFEHAMTLNTGSTAVSYEFMRIADDAVGRITFYASPRGAAAVAFHMVRMNRSSVIFENPSNDFPQRIAYAWDGDIIGEKLVATISKIDGSQAVSWTYRRPPERRR